MAELALQVMQDNAVLVAIAAAALAYGTLTAIRIWRVARRR